MHLNKIVSALALGCVIGRCTHDATTSSRTTEWSQIKELEPLKGGPPPQPVQRPRTRTRTLAKFGQMMFFDKDVAEAITVAGPVGQRRRHPEGRLRELPRHAVLRRLAPHLAGRAREQRAGPRPVARAQLPGDQHRPDGEPRLEPVDAVGGNLRRPVEHGTTVWGTSATVLAQARFVYTKYKDEYNAVFPLTAARRAAGPADDRSDNVYPATGGPVGIGAAPGTFEALPMDAQDDIAQFRANMGRAFDTYPRMLLTPDSPFQRYVQGDHAALTSAQKRGLKLFIGKAACSDCHNGPTLSDSKFHNIGAPNISILPGNAANQAPNRGAGHRCGGPGREAGRAGRQPGQPDHLQRREQVERRPA